MAVYHVSTTGTKASASGASIANDWSAANCYPKTLFTAVFGYIATGDEIILNDEVFSFTSTRNTTALSAGVTAFTLRSRSNDTALCKLTNKTSGTRNFLIKSAIAGNVAVTIKGINLSHDTDISSTTGIVAEIEGSAIASVEFSNCLLDLPTDNQNASGQSKLINTDSARQRTIKFTNGTKIANISLGTQAGNYVGLLSSATVTDYEFGDSTVAGDGLHLENITLNQNTSSFGLIKIDSNNATGHIIAKNITINATNNSLSVRGICHHQNTGFVDLSGDLDSIVINDGKAEALFLRSGGTHAVHDVTITNSHIYNPNNSGLGNTVSGLGFIVLGIANNAVGNYRNLKAVNCTGWFGLLTYQSAGATATHDGSFIARGCTVEGAVIYKGGSGDTFGKYASLLVEECHGNPDVVGLYAHNVNRPAEQRNSTFEWGTVTSRDNSGGNANGALTARFANNGAQFNFTATVHNILCGNSAGSSEVVRDETLSSAAGGLLNVVINNSHINRFGMIASSDTLYGNLTVLNENIADAGFTKTGTGGDSTLSSGSSAKTGCNKWWLSTDRRPSGSNEKPYPDNNISFGALQSEFIVDHPAYI